jgi:uncharacterized protein (DUF2141 family)
VYTSSGTYYDTITNAAGCDSITTINLTVNTLSASTITAAVCTQYTAPSGAVLTATGTYMDTIMNAAGCDSIITINLSVNQSFATIAPVSCDSFIAPGGAAYYVSGTYMDTVMNAAGCDSVITINLTVNSVNTATTQNGTVLSAVASGATYQWVNCPSMTPIAGATGQTYTALANGDYAVIVTENSCSDTSACLNVNGIGITENGFGSALNVYPNPSTGSFFIDLGATYTDVSVVVTDVTGRVVSAQLVNSANIIPVNIESAAGAYMIHVTTPGNSAVIKVVKE